MKNHSITDLKKLWMVLVGRDYLREDREEHWLNFKRNCKKRGISVEDAYQELCNIHYGVLPNGNKWQTRKEKYNVYELLQI